MPDALQDQFEELIPGAAQHAMAFLGVIQQRAASEGIGLDFVPQEDKSDRNSRRTVMVAKIVFGGSFAKGAPIKVIVFSVPVGSSLQVGWQLTEEELSSLLMNSYYAIRMHDARQMRNVKPENQRKLSGMLSAFHQAVFLPTVYQLVEATEGTRGGAGFLGA